MRTFVLFTALSCVTLSACGGQSGDSCSSQSDGSSCDDSNPCTTNDTCTAGSCSGTAVVCSGAAGCQGSTCDPSSGQCVSGAMPGPCSTSLKAIPLTGCSISDYTVPVKIGDGQTYQLTMDSGSSTTAVASSSCQNCGSLTPLYTPDTGAQASGRQTSADYGGGEGWDGTVYSDVISVGGVISDVRMDIASITSETIQSQGALPFFTPSYCSGVAVNNDDQGIFGLGGPVAAAPNTDAYMIKLANSTTPAVFTVQMCDSGGTIWFGGYDPSVVTSAPQFTPLLDSNDYYVIGLNDIEVAGITTTIPSADLGEVIVDTGTSVLLLPTAAYDSLSEAINNDAVFLKYFQTNFFNGNSCPTVPNMTATQLNAALPTMSLTFPGKSGGTFTVVLPATESYLTPTLNGSGEVSYCPAISSSDTSGRGSITVIGNSMLHSQITIFDRENAQIGFAPQQGCKILGN